MITKISKTILFVALCLVVSKAAVAGFGLPSTGNSNADQALNFGKNKGIEKAINDKLAKHNCQFTDDKTTSGTTCDINKVIADLTAWKSGLESTIANKINVNVKASSKSDYNLASTRAQEIRNKLYQNMNWWDYSVTSNTSEGNKLSIWVTVH